MNSILVTNNPYVFEKYKESKNVEYLADKTYIEVLEYVRNKLHSGHELLTHPLSGSIKPNETPYKTIMISKNKKDLDQDGLRIIEESLETTRKFIKDRRTPNWTESILDDFRVIDLSLIENVIDRLGR